MNDAPSVEERVLLLAPTGRDGLLVEQTLARAAIRSLPCASMDELCRRAEEGGGALLIAEEALTVEGVAVLSAMIERQPPWSDLPVIDSTTIGATTDARVRNLASLGNSANLVVLERPVRILTMVVAVQSALRARRRQYQMRNLTNQIEHERAKLEALIKQVPVAICILEGPQLRVTVANPSYLAMAQGRPIIGRPIIEVFPELRQAGLFERALAVYATGEPCDIPEYSFSFPENNIDIEYYQSAYRALRDEAGAIVGVVVVTLQLTDEVKARRALEASRAEAYQARAAAESANRAKDEFLAMLGHELRNPLAPISTALELMRLREGGAETKERAIIERQARHMTALVDDLLDVSRITRAKIDLRREVLELGELLGKAVETAAPLLQKRRHQLVTRVQPRTFYVNGDQARLTQVFSNILTNAAKYTDDGGWISIGASLEGAEVVVRIADGGSGISPKMLPHIFDLFSQEQQNLDRSQGGLGLGLAIVKSLVEMHGGRVSVSSAGKGCGSEFVVRLPTAAAPAATVAAVAAGQAAAPLCLTELPVSAIKPSILVVDDNKDAAEMLAEALQMMGYTTRVAHDGPDTLALAQSSPPPAVAFLDIGLPVMDGYELARRLRELPGWRAVALVALTGYGRDGDRQRSREAGFDLHLVKPIGMAALRKALESVRASRVASPARTEPSAAKY